MTQAPQKTQQQRAEDLATNVSPNKPVNSDAEGKLQTDFPEHEHHLKTPTQPVQQTYVTPSSNVNANNFLRKQLANGQSRQGNSLVFENEQEMVGSGIAGGQQVFINGKPSAPNQFNLSYQSFFNQPNIIGNPQFDPIVKPFSLSTPNHQTGPNFCSEQLASSDLKSSSSGQVSASKQIGAHLLQLQQTGAKQFPALRHESSSADLISVLRQLGSAYQLMSDYKCGEAIAQFRRLPAKQQQTGWVCA